MLPLLRNQILRGGCSKFVSAPQKAVRGKRIAHAPYAVVQQSSGFCTSSNDRKEENAAKRRRDHGSQTTEEIFAFVTDATLRELIWSLNEDQARKLKEHFLSNQFARFEALLQIESLTGFTNFLRRPKILHEFSRLLEIYPDFAVDEFMEGAEEAFCALNEAIAAGDKDFLQEVCEPHIRKVIFGTVDIFSDSSVLSNTLHIVDASKGCGGFTITSTNLTECYIEEDDVEQEDGGREGVSEGELKSFINFNVQFHGYVNIRIKMEEDSPEEYLETTSFNKTYIVGFRSEIDPEGKELEWKVSDLQ